MGDMALVKHYRDLRVYQSAFAAAMEIYELSKGWPRDERYSLIDQIRRSSRSVCGNIAEAWRKRRYLGHFVSKLSDADAEAAETENWLEFTFACRYVEEAEKIRLCEEYDRISAGLVRMMSNPSQWCGPALVREEPVPYAAEETLEEPELESVGALDNLHSHTPIPPHSQTRALKREAADD